MKVQTCLCQTVKMAIFLVLYAMYPLDLPQENTHVLVDGPLSTIGTSWLRQKVTIDHNIHVLIYL